MKFLCDNCKAKYQIPDEKVAGRTLRMKCRKCEHDIIIRGPGAKKKAAAKKKATASKPAAAPATDTASKSQRPSALGAEFRRKVASGSHELPTEDDAPENEWHVAINDVPVGPLKRAELARKIGSGAVGGESLVWREGLDDWRPLKEVEELAVLLQQRRRPSHPPPTAPARPPTPAAPPARPAGPRASRSGAFGLPEKDRSSPSSVVPIASRHDSSSGSHSAPPPAARASDSAPGFDLDFSSPSVPPPAAVPREAAPAPAPAPAAAAPAPAVPHEDERERKNPMVWFMLAAGIFFGMVIGLVAPRYLGNSPTASNTPTPTPAPAEPTPQIAPPDPTADLELPPEDEMAPDAGVEEAEAPAQAEDRPRRHASSSSMSTMTTPREPSTSTMMSTSMASSAALAAFQGGAGGITAPMLGSTDGSSMGSGQPLDDADVRRVVSRNRRSLQTCYERAARGQSNPPNARMNVSIRVGRSGLVTSASATGQDFGGLRSCIERSVRRWRFPASSTGGATRFPVVFSGR